MKQLALLILPGLEPISVESETTGVFGGGITYAFTKRIGIAF
jgi:hypothetical protein